MQGNVMENGMLYLDKEQRVYEYEKTARLKEFRHAAE